MQKILAFTIAILLTSVVAFAGDYPKVETFLGFTYMRANSATNVPAFSSNGGSGQVAVNFNKWAGFVMDMGATHNGNIGNNHLDSTFVNYLFGPRVSIRRSRLIPYFNILFGGVYAGNSIAVSATPIASTQPVYPPGFPVPPANAPVTLRAVASQTAFGMTTGGGLDIKINKWATFRPIGLDYFLTRFQNYRSANDNNQNNIRYTTGINFTFGAQ